MVQIFCIVFELCKYHKITQIQNGRLVINIFYHYTGTFCTMKDAGRKITVTQQATNRPPIVARAIKLTR